jgi:hypothetical protein
LSSAGQQSMILAARQRAADEGGWSRRVHGEGTLSVIPGRRSAGKFTQPAQAWLRCGEPGIHNHDLGLWIPGSLATLGTRNDGLSFA